MKLKKRTPTMILNAEINLLHEKLEFEHKRIFLLEEQNKALRINNSGLNMELVEFENIIIKLKQVFVAIEHKKRQEP